MKTRDWLYLYAGTIVGGLAVNALVWALFR